AVVKEPARPDAPDPAQPDEGQELFLDTVLGPEFHLLDGADEVRGKEPGEVPARVDQPGDALDHPVDITGTDVVAPADLVLADLVHPVGEEERGLEAPVELFVGVPG